jgi:hypothetical protein
MLPHCTVLGLKELLKAPIQLGTGAGVRDLTEPRSHVMRESMERHGNKLKVYGQVSILEIPQ